MFPEASTLPIVAVEVLSEKGSSCPDAATIRVTYSRDGFVGFCPTIAPTALVVMFEKSLDPMANCRSKPVTAIEPGAELKVGFTPAPGVVQRAKGVEAKATLVSWSGLTAEAPRICVGKRGSSSAEAFRTGPRRKALPHELVRGTRSTTKRAIFGSL